MTVSTNATSEWDMERWRDRAACLNTDPDRFFPAGNTGEALDQIRAAKAVCQQCPVTAPCLEYALRTNQESGVWGGRDEVERRRLRKLWRAGRLPSTAMRIDGAGPSRTPTDTIGQPSRAQST